MNQQEVLTRLQPIFRDVLDNEQLIVNRQSNAKNTPNWDSLSHISLIEIIESDFHMRFALGEIEEMKEVGDLVDLILRKGK